MIKSIQNSGDKEICQRSWHEITSGENPGFEVEYEGENLVLEEERTFFSDRRPVYG